MNAPIRSLLLATAFIAAGASSAQVGSSRGTTFWITFIENLDLGFNGNPYLYIVVSSEVTTQGELQVPATGDAFPFSVNAGHSTIVFVPSTYLYPIGAETYYANGLRLVSDDPVAVHAYHHRLYFTDATLVLPVEQLGTEYFVMAQLDVAVTAPSEFAVLATEDATEVEIVPAVQTASLRPAGVPFTITLDAGEVFQLQSFEDMTGSRVRSLDAAKPIAVFGGSKYGNEGCMGATDHFYTELMSTDRWGDRFALVPYLDRGGDDFKFLALEDGTTVTLSSGASFSLDSAEFVMQHITAAVIAEADHAIAIAQLNESQTCNAPGNGDGCMAFVPPVDHLEQLAIFNSITGPGMPGGGWTPDHTLNIVTTGQTGTINMDLDGTAIGSLFAPIPTAPAWYYARMNISEGEHVLQGTTPFQAQASGFGDYNGYGFFTGFKEEGIGTGIGPAPTGPGTSTTCIVANAAFVFDLSGLSAQRVEIVDARGAIVQRVVVSTVHVQLDATTLQPGLYSIVAHDATRVVIQRQRLVVVR